MEDLKSASIELVKLQAETQPKKKKTRKIQKLLLEQQQKTKKDSQNFY